jgi:Cu/Ag efflux protein CusF
MLRKLNSLSGGRSIWPSFRRRHPDAPRFHQRGGEPALRRRPKGSPAKLTRRSCSSLAIFFLCSLLALTLACNHVPSPTATSQSTKRYPFKGKVISLDQTAQTANIDNDPIPGFMSSMTMPYTLKPATLLAQLHPGDSITADVIVAPDKYWLENVKVTAHSAAGKAAPAGSQ